MKLLRVAVFVALAACAAGPAWAQYGLYGAPDMLQLQPTPAVAPSGLVAPSAYQAEQGPMVSGAVAAGPIDPTAPALAAAPLPPAPAGQATRTYAPTPAYGSAPAPVAATDPGYLLAARPASSRLARRTAAAAVAAARAQACAGLAGCGGNDWTCGEWYGSLLALGLTRGDHANKVWTSYDGGTDTRQPNLANQIMNTQDVGTGWEWGGELTFGRTFCCNQWSLEATYWTTNEFTGSACATIPGGYVNTPLITHDVCFGGVQRGKLVRRRPPAHAVPRRRGQRHRDQPHPQPPRRRVRLQPVEHRPVGGHSLLPLQRQSGLERPKPGRLLLGHLQRQGGEQPRRLPTWPQPQLLRLRSSEVLRHAEDWHLRQLHLEQLRRGHDRPERKPRLRHADQPIPARPIRSSRTATSFPASRRSTWAWIGRSRIASARGLAIAFWRRREWPWPTASSRST